MPTDVSIFVSDCATGCGTMCRVSVEFDNGERNRTVNKTCKTKNRRATVQKILQSYTDAGQDLPINIIYSPKL